MIKSQSQMINAVSNDQIVVSNAQRSVLHVHSFTHKTRAKNRVYAVQRLKNYSNKFNGRQLHYPSYRLKHTGFNNWQNSSTSSRRVISAKPTSMHSILSFYTLMHSIHGPPQHFNSSTQQNVDRSSTKKDRSQQRSHPHEIAAQE